MNKHKHNIYTLFISLYLCIFSVFAAHHYQYNTCLPANCGKGPDISFPFHVKGLRNSYCGHPGFEIDCRDEFPVLYLPENDYVLQDILYKNQSFRVFNSALLRLDGASCVPRMRNTTLVGQPQFDYVDEIGLRLFYNCTNLVEELSPYLHVGCRSLALYDGDVNLGNAMVNCQENVVVPVERDGVEGRIGISDVDKVLRRGFVLNWKASDCSECEESGGQCGFHETSFHFRCFCPDRPHARSCIPETWASRNKFLIAVIGGLAAAALSFTSIILILFFRRKYALQRLFEKDIELFLKNNMNLAPKRYKYSDIRKMTNSFKNNLGKGGYGSVYKGKLPDGHPVAVKVLDESKGNGEDFLNEVASISRTSHVNIVSLLGFCFKGSKRALIYEFMPNGSLEKFISNTDTQGGLGWQKLFEIALGIARGLEYLHQGCKTRILHFDIKPHNILLDNDFNPKISDFGLARLCPNRSSIVSMMVARGTIGYIAPEVFCRNFGEVSHKSDVYSYGMMVLEIAGGKKSIDRADVDRSSEIYFPAYIYRQLEMEGDGDDTHVEIMNEDESRIAKRKLIIVGLWCIQTDPKDRPSMSKVIEMLEGKLESLHVPPKPNMSSPSRSAPKFSTTESIL